MAAIFFELMGRGMAGLGGAIQTTTPPVGNLQEDSREEQERALADTRETLDQIFAEEPDR